MFDTTTWNDPVYREAMLIVFAFMATLGSALFPFRNKSHIYKAAWASWQSWMLALPVLFILIALEGYWPLAGFAVLATWGCREFFKMTGIYHKVWYLWTNFIFIWLTAYFIFIDNEQVFRLMPMIYLFAICLVPILSNDPKGMLQHISLGFIGYTLIAWGFLHLGLLLKFEYGARLLVFIILLTEIGDTLNLAFSNWFGKSKFFAKIAPRRKPEAFVLSTLITIGIAFGLRHLLPSTEEIYWLSAAIVASLAGGTGDIVLSGIRRDVNVRDRNAFIFGRSGLLERMDRLIFVAPLYYYVLIALGIN
ncbi:MAG: phosphatidate cytidylyltransferase [Bdellovibrionales bacterium]